jgi:hypothetical protein
MQLQCAYCEFGTEIKKNVYTNFMVKTVKLILSWKEWQNFYF